MSLRKKILFFISLLVAISFLLYLFLAVLIARSAITDSSKLSDAILVLGARSYIQKRYNPCLLARVEHAVTLYKNHKATKVIVSGGNDREDGVNEAETMRKIAIEKGVPANDILLEKQATSTYENLLFGKAILEKQNIRSVIIVTEPFHMARAESVAKKLGYTYTVSPAADSPCWTTNTYLSKYFLKEPIAYLIYKLQGKL